MITLELLQALCPKTKKTVLEGYLEPLNTVAQYYDMYDNMHRAAAFIAQTAHESGGFNFVKGEVDGYAITQTRAFNIARIIGSFS